MAIDSGHQLIEEQVFGDVIVRTYQIQFDRRVTVEDWMTDQIVIDEPWEPQDLFRFALEALQRPGFKNSPRAQRMLDGMPIGPENWRFKS